jgi:excisionase family DNA binding protein
MIESQPLPRFLTPEEVADLLRVSRRTVYNWLRAGELPALRIGKTWRIRREDIEPQRALNSATTRNTDET